MVSSDGDDYEDSDEPTDDDVMTMCADAADYDDNDQPCEQDINFDVGGEDDDKWKQENLGVVDRVVDVGPVRGAAKYQEVKTGSTKLEKAFSSVIRQKQPESPES